MKVIISDETLREAGKNKNCEMSFKEKLDLARHLDELNIDIIGVGPVTDTKTDSILFRTIGAFIKKSTISCSANATKESIDLAYEAIKDANKKILAINFPSSVMQMEYMYHKKPDKMLQTIDELVKYAKSLGVMVEAIFDDATRAEEAYLIDAINICKNNNCDYISVIDTAGIALPNEFKLFVENIKNKTGINNLGIGCSNSLALATACVFESINSVSYVKTTILGDELPKLDDVCQVIKTLGCKNNLEMNVDYTKFKDTVVEINKEHSSKVSIIKSSIVDDVEALDANMSIDELNNVLLKLGYDLSVQDQNSVYDTFKRVALKKGQIKLKELDVIVANVAMQVPQTYNLDCFVINSGNKIRSTASIVLLKNNEELFGLAYGDGPIDAAFKAIENIIGRSYELDDFQIKATTSGAEAMGEALVKLRYNGKLYSGRGISTDINGASIRAYIQAVNKISYEAND